MVRPVIQYIWTLTQSIFSGLYGTRPQPVQRLPGLCGARASARQQVFWPLWGQRISPSTGFQASVGPGLQPVNRFPGFSLCTGFQASVGPGPQPVHRLSGLYGTRPQPVHRFPGLCGAMALVCPQVFRPLWGQGLTLSTGFQVSVGPGHQPVNRFPGLYGTGHQPVHRFPGLCEARALACPQVFRSLWGQGISPSTGFQASVGPGHQPVNRFSGLRGARTSARQQVSRLLLGQSLSSQQKILCQGVFLASELLMLGRVK
ncbi:Atrial natriuretic peptide receptor 2 [Plakobranchus ocellatus]|uniref:Atrial natriuretic peptide receptor 2 n=1 Tax=Plakobranchus ocellatus TaxID=259542 RepID=A0AAV4AMU2_9GAST|nr:Atrial natriuretic peptide receptor 2 [Plakobranchus ocellatus]